MKRVLLLGLSGLMGWGGNAAATGFTDVTLFNEIREEMVVSAELEPLDANLAGELYDAFSGQLTFQVTDVELPGNFAIPVKVTRKLDHDTRPLNHFGDWELVLPKITGRFNQAADFDCRIPVPPTVDSVTNGANFSSSMYFRGLSLQDGAGYQGRLFRVGTSVPSPYTVPAGYSFYSKDNWIVRCDGADYVAQSPNGLTYYFDTLINERGGETIELSSGQNDYFIDVINYARLASRIEDRFGNSVSYDYDASGRLQSITASDGRLIEFGYTPISEGIYKNRIDTVTVNGRTWDYQYYSSSESVLVAVERPDGKSWQYGLYDDGCHGPCDITPSHPPQVFREKGGGQPRPTDNSQANYFTLSVTHPEGARAEYDFRTAYLHRIGMNLPVDWCSPGGQCKPPNQGCSFVQCKGLVASVALQSKRVYYSNEDFYTWEYSYSENTKFADIYDENYDAKDDAATRQTTTVTGPTGIEVTVFNRLYDWNEGAELERRYLSLQGETLSRTVKTYAQGPEYGIADNLYKGVNKVKERYSPRITNETQYQEGNEYYTDYSDFNVYGVAETLHGSNDFSLTERYTRKGFLQDQTLWLINLPTTTGLSADGYSYTTVSETTYYASAHAYKRLPYEEKAYGTWIKRYASYHTSGDYKGAPRRIEFNERLKQAGGGTSAQYRYRELNNFKRGKPRQVIYPARYNDVDTISASQTVTDDGWVTAITDLNGVTTRYAYDAIGKLLAIDLPSPWADTYFAWSTNAEGYQTRARQRCQLLADRSGCATAPDYIESDTLDFWLRSTLTTKTDTATNLSIYQNLRYNADNQVEFASYWSESSAELDGSYQVYDSLRRQRQSSQSGGGTRYTDYLANNRMRVTNERNYSTTTQFLAYGAPAYDQPLLIESPEGVSTQHQVNLFGDVLAITQTGPGKDGIGIVSQTEYRAYDSQHHLCKTLRQDVGQTVMANNLLGEVQWVAEGVSGGGASDCLSSAGAAEKVLVSYDNLGGTQKVDYPDSSPDAVYLRNNEGQITLLTSGAVQQHYQYNPQGMLEHESLQLDGKTLNLDYGYNSAGQLDSLTYPDGTLVDYAPNAFGQPTQAASSSADYALSARYYPNGLIDSFSYGNGLQHKTTLNDRGLPASVLEAAGATTAQHFEYQYDAGGNITRITDHQNSAYSLTSLTYDGLDRLTGTNGNSGIGSSQVNYDGLGNITGYSTKTHTLDYQYDEALNRLDSVTGTKAYSFQYDSRDNVTHNGARAFGFNRANQVAGSGGNSYVYDGYNRRVKTQDSQGLGYSLYSQAGVLLYRELDDKAVNYIYLGKRLVAKEGTLPVASNSRRHYAPFGATLEEPSDDVGYTGHKYDKDLDLVYAQARYYDPVIGRFYSNDPVGFTGNIHSFNRYAYANNNPNKFVDPDGMTAIIVGSQPPVPTGILRWLGPSEAVGGGRVAIPRVGESAASVARRQAALNNLQRLGQKTEISKSARPEVSGKPDLIEGANTIGNLLGDLVQIIDHFVGGIGSVSTENVANIGAEDSNYGDIDRNDSIEDRNVTTNEDFIDSKWGSCYEEKMCI